MITANQCLRTYNSGEPWLHFPISRHVRVMPVMVMVRPRQTNSRGSPGPPVDMSKVSQVAVTGLIASLTNRSGMITALG